MTPDRAFIERAVALANPIALRVALYQATGDPEVKAITATRVVVAGSDSVVIADRDQLARLHELAVEYLLHNAGTPPAAAVPEHQIDALVQMAEARTLSPQELVHRRTLPNFDEFAYSAAWSGEPAIPEGFTVAIIGGGFAGVGMAVQLDQLGIPWDLFERRDEVGGVWSINTYPDARVDTLSTTYQYGFEKNYPWTQHFAPQAEVRDYIEHIARSRGLWDRVRLGHDVKAADWDPASGTWNLTIEVDGERTIQHRANVTVSGSGLFATPKRLDVPGIERFQGRLLHTTEWSDDLEIEGKRVAVVGNGSTGVQIVSSIAEQAAHLFVCQRTPQWIMPRENYKAPVEPELRWLLGSMPYYWNWDKYVASMTTDLRTQLILDEEWIRGGGQVNPRNDALREVLKQYIARQVGGRQDLIDRLIPTYPPITRRPVVDNGWYASLTRPNVELVTEGIVEVDEEGLVLSGGAHLDVDVVVTAVGFDTQRYLWPTEYRGRDGITLAEAWKDRGPQAYLGMTVPGFPNLFMLYGPNSQPLQGGNGLVGWFEVWSAYIAQTIVEMIEGGHASVEIRKEVCDAYNDLIDAEAEKLSYLRKDEAFGRNYYVNEWGRLQVATPLTGEEIFALSSRPNLDDFLTTPVHKGSDGEETQSRSGSVVGAR